MDYNENYDKEKERYNNQSNDHVLNPDQNEVQNDRSDISNLSNRSEDVDEEAVPI